ncbi:uncharacterized protein C11orf97 homolog isoform X2 [Protopterus annectens]|uniref:uncharacterized protein C11orf97 homolog isoform X2 n=1 Tax=Protopterus annectens TaxID=7888 RepID=UPI001CFBCF33|nr:uncharacterized protein C11orf97 homolog isoform X2 [Protopterus annectens]
MKTPALQDENECDDKQNCYPTRWKNQIGYTMDTEGDERSFPSFPPAQELLMHQQRFRGNGGEQGNNNQKRGTYTAASASDGQFRPLQKTQDCKESLIPNTARQKLLMSLHKHSLRKEVLIHWSTKRSLRSYRRMSSLEAGNSDRECNL